MASVVERLPGRTLGRVVRTLLVIIGLAPLAAPFLEQVPLARYLAVAFNAWFDFQCHRELGRSFELWGRVLPVCSRCFGIYLGLGLGALALRPRLEVWPLRIWVALAALAMILDVVTESLGMRPPSGWVRFVTGVVLAYPVGAALVRTARGEEAEGK